MSTEDTENTEFLDSKKFYMGEETYAVRGAVYEVYRTIGCGFLESVYQECLEIEFAEKGIPYVAQHKLDLYYKGHRLTQTYRPDFVCFDKIIVEIKALSKITGEHKAQVMNYLKATDMKVGLLINFGSFPKATVDRIVF